MEKGLIRKAKPRQERSIRNRIRRSFLKITIFVILIFTVVSYYSVTRLYQLTRHTHELETAQTRKEVTAAFDAVERQSIEIGRETYLQEVLRTKVDPAYHAYHGEGMLRVSRMVNDFTQRLQYQKAMDFLLFYDTTQDSIIVAENEEDQRICHDEAATLYFRERLGIDEQALRRLKNIHYGTYYVAAVSGQNELYYVYPVGTRSGQTTPGLLFCRISSANIRQELGNYEQGYYLYFGSSLIVSGTGTGAPAVLSGTDRPEPGEQRREGALLVDCAGIRDGICLYSIYNVGNYFSTVVGMALLFTLTIVAALAWAFYRSSQLSRQYAAPFQQLVSEIVDAPAQDEELTFSQAKNSVQGKTDYFRRVENLWQKNMFALILNGQERDEDHVNAFIRTQLKPSEDGYYVVRFHIKNTAAGNDADTDTDLDLRDFCVENVMGEVMAPWRACRPARDMDCVYMLLCRPPQEEWTAAWQSGSAFLREHFQIEIGAGSSALFTDMLTLPERKSEAYYAEEYAGIAGITDRIAVYQEMTGTADAGLINQTQENLVGRFMDLVRRGQLQEAEDLLAGMDLSGTNYDHIRRRQNQLYVLLTFLNISLRERGGQPSAQKLQGSSLEELRETGIRILEEMKARQSSAQEPGSRFLSIRAYVDENLTDPNLSVGMVCDHFHCSYPYVTDLFKANTGGSLTDYIQRARVEIAKTRLAAGAKVVDVANHLGFASVRTFIRVFKKYEGVTPGQYKKE